MTTFFTAANNWTTVIPVPTPIGSSGSNRTFSTVSSDLRYSVWDNVLFRFDSVGMNWSEVYSMPVHSLYTVLNAGDRVVFVGINNFVGVGGINIFNYSMEVLEYWPNNSTNLISSFVAHNVVQGAILKFSPRGDAVLALYVNTSMTESFVAKRLDYVLKTSTDILISDAARIRNIVLGINYDT